MIWSTLKYWLGYVLQDFFVMFIRIKTLDLDLKAAGATCAQIQIHLYLILLLFSCSFNVMYWTHFYSRGAVRAFILNIYSDYYYYHHLNPADEGAVKRWRENIHLVSFLRRLSRFPKWEKSECVRMSWTVGWMLLFSFLFFFSFHLAGAPLTSQGSDSGHCGSGSDAL